MDVNDNAYFLNKRAALESIASKLAPTQGCYFRSFRNSATGSGRLCKYPW
jgi:hypothetical protein